MRKFPAKMFLVITVAFGVVGYSFMEAAWTAPSANPPASNVAEPINEGSSSQTKTGALNVGSLGSGPILIDGDIRLDNPSPAVMLNDSDAGEKAFWLQANGNSLYVLADRANGISNPSYIGHDPWPLQIFTGATTSNDFATFSNEVRATQFCNRAGANCFTPADVTTPMSTSTFLNTSATAQSKAGSLTLSGTAVMTAPRLTATTQVRSPQYCDASGANCATTVEMTKGATCRVETFDALNVNGNQSRITATCNTDEVVTGGGCNTTETSNSLQDFPSGNGWQCYKHSSENTGTRHSVFAMCCKK